MMNAEKFVKGLHKEAIDNNLNIYKDLFRNTKLEDIQDEYWLKALPFYNKLSTEDKEIFYQILRQVSVDTVSNILAVLDGVTLLEGVDGEVKLLTSDNQKISGDLQDIFIELEYEE